jgi:peptidoglycan/xylan/chitin deacetylase (PgdA/CDA1 family)
MNNEFENETETERGVEAFMSGYHGGFSSLQNRISHNISARLPIKKIKMNLQRPMITFSFDDVSLSAAESGAEILETYNARGTYYISTDLMGRHISGSLKANGDEIKILHQHGHEIGLHSHAHLPVFSYSRVGLNADLAENKARLNEIIPNLNAENYCYPYGVSTLQHKLWLSSKVRSARCLWKSVNKKHLDPYFLRGQMLDQTAIDDRKLDNLLEDAKAQNGWLIFITHQVNADSRQLSTHPEMLKRAITKALDMGFDIVTINEGLDKISNFKKGI